MINDQKYIANELKKTRVLIKKYGDDLKKTLMGWLPLESKLFYK